MRALRALTPLVLLLVTAMAATTTYTVKRGETLDGIAHRHGVTTRSLAAANRIANPDRIYVGQRLAVPAGDTGGGAAVHVVREGESLARIARRYDTTVAALAAANAIADRDLVRIGRRLVIPQAASAPAAAADGTCPVRGAGRWDFVDGYGSPRAGGRRHMGIDIFARHGTPVVAPLDGVVRHVTNPLGGLAFELTAADGTRVYGAHLSGLEAPGRVEAGDVVGWVGATGNAAGTPPHLHLEWYPGGGANANPYGVLREWCG